MHSWNSSVKPQNAVVQREIEWVFNLPAASHMGGVWERQIRTLRKVFHAIVGTQVLDKYSLITLFCEIEDAVNRRPITPGSSDRTNLKAITPMDYILIWKGDSPLAPERSQQERGPQRMENCSVPGELFSGGGGGKNTCRNCNISKGR